MSDRLRRYDQFGWDYEVLMPLRGAEVAWHERWARRTGAPGLVDCPIDLPAITVSEYVQMFGAAGFDTRVHIACRAKKDDGISPVVCYVCSPHGGRRIA